MFLISFKKYIALTLLSIGLINYSLAATPIVNATDTSFMTTYTAQVSQLVNQLNVAQNAYQQVQALKGLQSLQAAGQGLCNLCNPTDAANLAAYIDNINSDLCQQFSNIMTNLTQSQMNFSNLGQILNMFQTNPSAASVGLQQTSVALLGNMQSTLTQMNAMQAQQIQKDLAQQKLNKQTSLSWISGATHGN